MQMFSFLQKNSFIKLFLYTTFISALINNALASGKFGICVLTPDNNSTLYGNVSFQQASETAPLRVDYNIQNIIGVRAFHIHTFPNITGGCLSTGGHYNPTNSTHGGPKDETKHVGDFGNLQAVNNQIKQTVFYNGTSLYGEYSILNRACVIHKDEDDLGLGNDNNSLLNGNAGTRIGCGVLIEVNEEVFLSAAADNVKLGFAAKLVTIMFMFVGVFLI